MKGNANVDFCGVRNLLRMLEQHGFSEAELKRIEARVAIQLGATIVFGEGCSPIALDIAKALWYCVLLNRREVSP